jgi:hypothetical protein
MEDNYPTHVQHFEVVMLRDGVDQEAAQPADFLRVAILARDPVAAQNDPDIGLVKGYRPVAATLPNQLTGFELAARNRELVNAPTRSW